MADRIFLAGNAPAPGFWNDPNLWWVLVPIFLTIAAFAAFDLWSNP